MNYWDAKNKIDKKCKTFNHAQKNDDDFDVNALWNEFITKELNAQTIKSEIPSLMKVVNSETAYFVFDDPLQKGRMILVPRDGKARPLFSKTYGL